MTPADLNTFLRRSYPKSKPEMRAKQRIVEILVKNLGYQPEQIAAEPELHIKCGSTKLRLDVAVFLPGAPHDQQNVFLIVECKKPNGSSTTFEGAVEQLKSYMSACSNAHYGVAYDMNRCLVVEEVKGAKGLYEFKTLGTDVRHIPRAVDLAPKRFTVIGTEFPMAALPPVGVAPIAAPAAVAPIAAPRDADDPGQRERDGHLARQNNFPRSPYGDAAWLRGYDAAERDAARDAARHRGAPAVVAPAQPARPDAPRAKGAPEEVTTVWTPQPPPNTPQAWGVVAPVANAPSASPPPPSFPPPSYAPSPSFEPPPYARRPVMDAHASWSAPPVPIPVWRPSAPPRGAVGKGWLYARAAAAVVVLAGISAALLAGGDPEPRQPARAAAAAPYGLPAAVPSAGCVVRAASNFNLRPYETAESVGAEYPGGTMAWLGAATNTTRNASRLFQVRVVGDGAVGWMFLNAEELAPCAGFVPQ